MRKILEKHPAAFYIIWFLLLAVLFTWPLVLNCRYSIAGQIGDNVYFIWMIGWIKKALFDLKTNPLNVWFLNYPEGWNMARTEMTPIQLLLALPFDLIGGETFGYNAAMLLSFALSGLIMGIWVRHLTGSSFAGLISGTIFACLPYRQAHYLAGHLNLSGTQWLPLFFMGWFDLFKPGESEFRKKSAVLAGIGFGLTALTSQYYVFMLAVIAGIQALFMLIFYRREWFADKNFWKGIGVFLLAAAPLTVLAEYPFFKLAGSGGMPSRDWGAARMYSAGLSDFFLPGTTHFLFGKWIGSHFNRDYWIEATLYIGLISLLLMLYALKKSGKRDGWIRPLLLCGIISSVILAMGTDLHWNGSPVEFTLPHFLAEKLGRTHIPILLPGYFMFKYFPFYNKQRALMRMGIFALMLMACGAGLGAQFLTEKTKGLRKEIVSWILLTLVLFDFWPASQKQFVKIGPRAVDKFLASQTDNGSVMRYPFYLNDDQAGTYYTLYNNKPFIGGFFNAFPPEQYLNISGVMSAFPSQESTALAKKLGVEYFLVEKDETEKAIADGSIPWKSMEEIQAACEKYGLYKYGTYDGVVVYMFGEGCDCKWLKKR